MWYLINSWKLLLEYLQHPLPWKNPLSSTKNLAPPPFANIENFSAPCRKRGKGRTPCVCFLKYPWKQCNSPLNISSINLETCEIFLKFNINISNTVMFLPIFKFMLITCHNIMTCNLESHVFFSGRSDTTKAILINCAL